MQPRKRESTDTRQSDIIWKNLRELYLYNQANYQHNEHKKGERRKAVMITRGFSYMASGALLCIGLLLGDYGHALAHCDTMAGPVIQDARKALEKGDVTPVLKWVREKDERAVKGVFTKALAAKGKKNQESAERKFFETLVRIHRAGEGEPFTGLRPASEVEPAVAEADKSLESGTADGLVTLMTDAVAKGIRERYERAAEAAGHKDESVEAGRRYVEAYVEFTHYVERLHMDAEGHEGHNHGEKEKKGMKSHHP